MNAGERYARLKELEAGMGEALKARAEAQARFDALRLEYELLSNERYDENCPCTGQDEAGNNRCTSGHTF